MKRCNSKHMRFKGYADGGKVEPTYARAVMARLGFGDGYGNSLKKPKQEPKKMDVSNATQTMSNVAAKRKKMLDDI